MNSGTQSPSNRPRWPIRWRQSPSLRWACMAALVGLAVGVGCILLDFLTESVGYFFLGVTVGYADAGAIGEAKFLPESQSNAAVNVFTALRMFAVISMGGLLSGWLVHTFAPETAGAGTDAAVDAFHNQKGEMRGRVIWIKMIASALTLGSAGPAGKEGPIAQIGAAIGSLIGEKLRLSARDRRILLAAGMGAGVGAMFRAPLAGAIFASEILYSDADMEADVLVPGAVASIVAYSVYTQAIEASVRYQPLFGDGIDYGLQSPLELLLYLLLGLLVFLLSAGYTQFFRGVQDVFAKMELAPHWRPALGAALAGLVGIFVYCLGGFDVRLLAIFGTGYGVLQQALVGGGSLSILLLISIALGKMVTSSLAIGSGGSGGVFAPSMVIGGCTGAAYGLVVQQIAPDLVPNPETYGVVGMAGFFTGVARAPISTIIMVRELTGDFGLLVPTMLVCSFTFVASSRWRLYRNQVPTRLESPAHRGDFLIDVLEGLRVEDVFREERDFVRFHEGETLDAIVHKLTVCRQNYFPVVDDAGDMIGLFSDSDIRAYLYDESLWKLANASDVMTSPFEKIFPNDDLNIAMTKFVAMNLDELPVMDQEEPNRILGFLRRKELIAAYNQRVVEVRDQMG